MTWATRNASPARAPTRSLSDFRRRQADAGIVAPLEQPPPSLLPAHEAPEARRRPVPVDTPIGDVEGRRRNTMQATSAARLLPSRNG